MFRFLATLLLVVGVSAFLGSGDAHLEVKRRKSLAFGSVLPQAVYVSTPSQLPSSTLRSKDPYFVAHLFVKELLGKEGGFKIRNDSYTDKNTGITHVYVRQIINEIEVADGNINVNVKDGVVLSFGNSFYDGPIPDPFTSPADDIAHPHVQYCDALFRELNNKREILSRQLALQGDQAILSPSAFKSSVLDPSEQFYKSNCEFVDVPYSMHSDGPTDLGYSSHNALLQFVIAATTKPDVAKDILARYDEYLAEMWSEFSTGLTGDYSTRVEAIHGVPDTVKPVKAALTYVQVPRGSETFLNLVWKFEVGMDNNWYEAYVSASSPHRIVNVIDWVADSHFAPIPPPTHKLAIYNIYKFGVNDPSDGNRTLDDEHFEALASPRGWHSLPFANDPQTPQGPSPSVEFWRNTTTTWGNNVFAQEDWRGYNRAFANNYRPDAGSCKLFHYPYDPKPTNESTAPCEARIYINFTITQIFYTSNMIHDLYYRYGFDEVAGNFQQYNFGLGGRENDAVIAYAQDGEGINNANFLTPPDGQNPWMKMYIWTTTNPYRDGGLDAGIVIHELTHGLSTRLTGGPQNSGCLPYGESGGMGEGWSDFFATTVRSHKVYSDYPMGAWPANRAGGIRWYPYSTNPKVNPSTYKLLDTINPSDVHSQGAVWAEILWVVSQKLIKKYGFVESLFPPAPLANGTVPEGDFYRPRQAGKPLIPKHGNSLMVQLVLNGLKLQPCIPKFLDARNAIIDADQNLTGGENYCLLWEGFAERGLGYQTTVNWSTPSGVRTEDYAVPPRCRPAL